MTQPFDIPVEDRMALLPCHRAFQATIAHRAKLIITPNTVDKSWQRQSAGPITGLKP